MPSPSIAAYKPVACFCTAFAIPLGKPLLDENHVSPSSVDLYIPKSEATNIDPSSEA